MCFSVPSEELTTVDLTVDFWRAEDAADRTINLTSDLNYQDPMPGCGCIDIISKSL